MADSADVEQALAALLSGIFYPNGTAQPSSVVETVTLMRGWPTEAQVASAVANNSALVSIHADKGMSRDSTRYFWNAEILCGAPTITATISGNTVTLAGAVSVGQALAIQSAGIWYPYLVKSGDTLGTIAAALAGLIPSASATGAVVTLRATGGTPAARIVATGSTTTNVGRQRAMFRISVWTPTPGLRDAIFAQIPAAVTYLGFRLAMPDGSVATQMHQQEAGPDDLPNHADEWRRDLLCDYEFSIAYTSSAIGAMLFEVLCQAQTGPAVSVGDDIDPAFL